MEWIITLCVIIGLTLGLLIFVFIQFLESKQKISKLKEELERSQYVSSVYKTDLEHLTQIYLQSPDGKNSNSVLMHCYSLAISGRDNDVIKYLKNYGQGRVKNRPNMQTFIRMRE